MSDDITMLDSDDSQFETVLSNLPKGDPAVKVEWLEDEYLPYTEYDRQRDIVKWRRLQFLRRIAPRV